MEVPGRSIEKSLLVGSRPVLLAPDFPVSSRKLYNEQQLWLHLIDSSQ
jgi:hypothetical protein